jgi:hypothetical protein
VVPPPPPHFFFLHSAGPTLPPSPSRAYHASFNREVLAHASPPPTRPCLSPPPSQPPQYHAHQQPSTAAALVPTETSPEARPGILSLSIPLLASPSQPATGIALRLWTRHQRPGRKPPGLVVSIRLCIARGHCLLLGRPTGVGRGVCKSAAPSNPLPPPAPPCAERGERGAWDAAEAGDGYFFVATKVAKLASTCTVLCVANKL